MTNHSKSIKDLPIGLLEKMLSKNNSNDVVRKEIRRRKLNKIKLNE